MRGWSRPSLGTLTLLFSDIEGSTRLLSELGVRYGEVLSVQRSIIREEINRWNGVEIGTEGDVFVVFASASDAVRAARAANSGSALPLARRHRAAGADGIAHR